MVVSEVRGPHPARGRRVLDAVGLAVAIGCVIMLSAACSQGRSRSDADAASKASRVGRDPVSAVHLLENHSSALVVWRRAGVRDRILVHVDGHADLDWIPDETVARIAAATPDELPNLELHPYAMDGTTLGRFGIWNFIYPAARLGIVREVIWVVPDGTLRDRESQAALVRNLLVAKIQGVGVTEARSLKPRGRAVQGTLLGLPITVCEIADLPEIPEPVLLDLDLDYLTTRSALTQEVREDPGMSPESLIRALEQRGLRSDLATISLSTMGGFLPPASRWLGKTVRDLLRSPGASPGEAIRGRLEADRSRAAGEGPRAVGLYRRLLERDGEDATLWLSLAAALREMGREEEAAQAQARAVALDPVLRHVELFEGDRLWLNENYDAALGRYRSYLDRFPRGPFAAYALRREAGCLMRLNRDEEAIAAYRRVVEVAPEHADSRVELGVLLRERGDLDGALVQLRLARRILPERATCALALGTTLLMAGRPDEAAAELQAAVERQPCQAMARANLALALFQLRRFDDAAGQLRAALEFQPANPQMNQLASQLVRRGVPVTRVSARP